MIIPLKGSIEHVAKKNQYFTTDRIEVVRSSIAQGELYRPGILELLIRGLYVVGISLVHTRAYEIGKCNIHSASFFCTTSRVK